MTTTTQLTEEAQRFLLDTAIEAVRARLEERAPAPVTSAPLHGTEPPPEVHQPGASFVTLREGRRLLGCVGSMLPVRPLDVDVAANAVNAAFADPRLPALTPEEFVTMEVKISVLTPLVPMAVRSLRELQSTIVPGEDGLLIQSGMRRGTFLPSVWEQVSSVDEFLTMLWRKAGLRPGTWPSNITVERYQTYEFGDPGPRAPISR